ncbi:hypothetical protein [Calothrix sp. NIES-3974]|uniref:hypothetical protein n=1 Tax=Calothrix sp. NIES-3974 TaxID=2005462 RepID=UPI000B5EA89F|nr:hypothetical protein [Calothrix sp. NIES-3974]BAZ07652.1 hypothetical protein NIES3974_43160 [Calothrix sp. NIES-3974]
MTVNKLSISASILGMVLLSLPLMNTPALAGRYNASNNTGTNTSNNTGTNTSNNTGGNTSNNTGGNNTNQQGKTGYNAQIVARSNEIAARLRAAIATGDQHLINAITIEARQFLTSLQQPQPKHLQHPMVRSQQGW